jgi:hypothetical protein
MANQARSDIVDAQTCQFGDSETRAHRQVQYGSVSNSHSRGWIRSIEQGLHFFLGQIRHQTMVGFFEGDCQNAANLSDGGWLVVLQDLEERTDSSQTDISCLRGVATHALQMF